jgi:hypothetical protein
LPYADRCPLQLKTVQRVGQYKVAATATAFGALRNK